MRDNWLVNGQGESVKNPTAEEMRAFLRSVDWSDQEHGAAWYSSDEDDVSLEINADGRLVLTVEEEPTRHLPQCAHEKVVELWLLLARGEIVAILKEDWQPGLCSPQVAERAAIRAAESAYRLDREFFLSLGPEGNRERCSTDGCDRGRVSQSVSCRVHHFEDVRRRPCPFND